MKLKLRKSKTTTIDLPETGAPEFIRELADPLSRRSIHEVGGGGNHDMIVKSDPRVEGRVPAVNTYTCPLDITPEVAEFPVVLSVDELYESNGMGRCTVALRWNDRILTVTGEGNDFSVVRDDQSLRHDRPASKTPNQ